MIKRSLILFCAALALAGGARFAAAQDSSSQDSVADASRKAQAEKKAEPKPAKVYTDDNIGAVQGQISVVGPGQASDTASSDKGDQSSAATSKDKDAGAKKDEGYYRKKFADLRAKLADDQKKVDDLQHEYSVKQQQYYADPNTAMKEQYTRQDIDATQAELDKKKQDVTDDQQAISDLEDDAFIAQCSRARRRLAAGTVRRSSDAAGNIHASADASTRTIDNAGRSGDNFSAAVGVAGTIAWPRHS